MGIRQRKSLPEIQLLNGHRARVATAQLMKINPELLHLYMHIS